MKPFEPRFRYLGPEDFQHKPAPAPQQQPWHCLICGGLEFRWHLPGDIHEPDVCPRCLQLHARQVATPVITKTTRFDRAHYRALSAVLGAITSEIENGRFTR